MPVKKTKATKSAKSLASRKNRPASKVAKKPVRPTQSALKTRTDLPHEELAKIHQALAGAAKTPEQHADAAVVRAAAEEAEKGNHSTARSLLAKVSAWVHEEGPSIVKHLKEHVQAEGVKQLANALQKLAH